MWLHTSRSCQLRTQGYGESRSCTSQPKAAPDSTSHQEQVQRELWARPLSEGGLLPMVSGPQDKESLKKTQPALMLENLVP